MALSKEPWGEPLTIVLEDWPPPGSSLTGNGRRRSHWRKQHKETRQVHEMVWAKINEVCGKNLLPRWDRVRLNVEFVVPDNRRRDGSNYHIAVKPIEDALVLLRVMPDDDIYHCWTTSYVAPERGVRQTRITIKEWGWREGEGW